MSSRREFLTATLAATGAAALAPRWAAAQPKSMTVVHESSFIKPFDEFFVKTLSPEYDDPILERNQAPVRSEHAMSTLQGAKIDLP